MKYINFDQTRFETVPANTPLLVTQDGIIIPEYYKTKYSYPVGYATDGFIYSMEYPLGRFIRRASRTEIPKEDALFVTFSKSWTIEKAHDWVYLWSALEIDDSQFREGLHCNGGAYSFSRERRFFARIQGDDLRFCYLDVHKTSSEFAYCELTGQFCNELVPIWFQGMDNEPEICMNVQEARNLNLEVGDNYWEGCPLDRVATMCEFSEAWNSSYIVITEDGEESFPPTMQEKKDRVRMLKVLGAITNGEYKRAVVLYHRANRADRQRYRKTQEEIQQIIEKM